MIALFVLATVIFSTHKCAIQENVASINKYNLRPNVQYKRLNSNQIKERLNTFSIKRQNNNHSAKKNPKFMSINEKQIKNNDLIDVELAETIKGDNKDTEISQYLKLTENNNGNVQNTKEMEGNIKETNINQNSIKIQYDDKELAEIYNENNQNTNKIVDNNTETKDSKEELSPIEDYNQDEMETHKLAVKVLKKQKELLTKLLLRTNSMEDRISLSDEAFDSLMKTFKPRLNSIATTERASTKTNKGAVENIAMDLIDEAQIRQALLRDPLVQRVLKIYALKNKGRLPRFSIKRPNQARIQRGGKLGYMPMPKIERNIQDRILIPH